jgi:hypothetical protein
MLWQPNCQRLWWLNRCGVADRVLPRWDRSVRSVRTTTIFLNSYKQTDRRFRAPPVCAFSKLCIAQIV